MKFEKGEEKGSEGIVEGVFSSKELARKTKKKKKVIIVMIFSRWMMLCTVMKMFTKLIVYGENRSMNSCGSVDS